MQTAADNMRRLLVPSSVNDYNKVVWKYDCMSICSGPFECRPIVRGNFEVICTNGEVFTAPDLVVRVISMGV